MANNRTLTAANAILMLGVTGLFTVPRRLQGFAADNITDLGDLTLAETSMGVDGRLSAGYVNNAVTQNITLQADSESNDMFEFWQQTMRQRLDTYFAFGSILLRATGRRYTLTRGVLTSASVMPAVNKTLQPRRFTLTWESVSGAPG